MTTRPRYPMRRAASLAEARWAVGVLLACLAAGWLILGWRTGRQNHWPVAVVTLGAPDEGQVEALLRALRREHRLRRLPPAGSPAAAWDPARGQYDADRYLAALADLPLRRGERLLAIANEPAGTPELTIVFGLAEQAGRRAVIFTRRLTDDAPPEAARHRLLTTARHELGHLGGLRHCAVPTCAMHYSHSVADTDAKGPGFCPACQRAWQGR